VRELAGAAGRERAGGDRDLLAGLPERVPEFPVDKRL
jgi:hypothetical protein